MNMFTTTTCKKHPNYKAIRIPSSDCITCLNIFVNKHGSWNEIVEFVKNNPEFYQKFVHKNEQDRKEKGMKVMYKLKSPKGKIYKTDNLAKFARKYRLSRTGLSKIVNGRQMSHKNWTVG